MKEKIRRLVEGGFEELQFIVDFDFTMTRAHKYARSVVMVEKHAEAIGFWIWSDPEGQ